MKGNYNITFQYPADSDLLGKMHGHGRRANEESVTSSSHEIEKIGHALNSLAEERHFFKSIYFNEWKNFFLNLQKCSLTPHITAISHYKVVQFNGVSQSLRPRKNSRARPISAFKKHVVVIFQE